MNGVNISVVIVVLHFFKLSNAFLKSSTLILGSVKTIATTSHYVLGGTCPLSCFLRPLLWPLRCYINVIKTKFVPSNRKVLKVILLFTYFVCIHIYSSMSADQNKINEISHRSPPWKVKKDSAIKGGWQMYRIFFFKYWTVTYSYGSTSSSGQYQFF